jgi:lipopolysaccharide biosynthesis glycosyltransferase
MNLTKTNHINTTGVRLTTDMKLGICTLNIDNFLSDNSRHCFESFCNKYGVDFLEYTERHHPCVFYSKFFITDICKDYDFVVYMDADMIIMEDSPNFILEFDFDKLNVVKENFKNNDANLIKIYKDETYPVCKMISTSNVDYTKFSYNYFNAGFIGFQPSRFIKNFVDLQKCVDKIGPELDYYSAGGKLEQSLTNYELQSNNDVNHLSYKFNDYDYRPDSFIYHFTGEYLNKDRIHTFKNERPKLSL